MKSGVSMGVERSNKRMKLTSGAKAKARRAARSLCAVLYGHQGDGGTVQ